MFLHSLGQIRTSDAACRNAGYAQESRLYPRWPFGLSAKGRHLRTSPLTHESALASLGETVLEGEVWCYRMQPNG